MAATLDQIAGYLKEDGVRFKQTDGFIKTGFHTESYRDGDGDEGLQVVIDLSENGEYIKILAPMAYHASHNEHLKELFQALLMVSWKTKLVQFEYDESDGEIRAIVEFPLEDAPLTKRQFMRSVGGLVEIVDKFDPMIRKAMEDGVIEPPETDTGLSSLMRQASDAGLLEEFREFLEQRREMQRDNGLELED